MKMGLHTCISKYLLVLFICCLYSFKGHSQELITLKIKNKNPNPWKELYQVIKDSSVLGEKVRVKHGYYKKYYKRVLIEKGSYSFNLKEGAWVYFNKKGDLMAEGSYHHNKKIGLWNYYSYGGIKVHIYDHDVDSLIYFNLNEESKLGYAPKVFPDTAWEQLPIFIGGTAFMRSQIENNMIYPRAAWLNYKSAKVLVTFVVDKEGNTSQIKVPNPVGNGFDEEAIRLVEMFGKAWIPGVQNGKKVSVKFTLPLKFSLD